MSLLVLIWAFTAQAPAPAHPPTQAAMHRALEGAASSLVEVRGPHGSGPGILVGSGGEVLTTVDFVGLDRAQVKTPEGQVDGRVLAASARSRIALVQLSAPTAPKLVPAAVATRSLQVGDYIFGVQRAPGGRLKAVVGRVYRAARGDADTLATTLTLPAGTPVMDGRGELLGLVVVRTQVGSRVAPISAVKLALAEARP